MRFEPIAALVAAAVMACPCASGAEDFSDIFDDANSAFHDWVPSCSQDRVTLEHSCTLTKVFPEAVFTVFYSRGDFCLSPAPNDHPGAVGIIRVDNKVHQFRAEFACGAKAKAIVSGMLKGSRAAVRTIHWPDRQIEYEFDLDGFALAHKAFEGQIARLPK